MSACSLDNLLSGGDPPEGSVVEPNDVRTYEGAVGVYHSSIHAMKKAISFASLDVGIFTDELSSGTSLRIDLDSRTKRIGDEGLTSIAYDSLHAARIRAAQASELLLRYGTEASYPMVGHAYALQAEAILLLAELFCSGVPLTKVPFENDLQFTPGLSTTTLLERAIALFDTAYTYGSDSLPIATLARVGKGRALLNLGKYAEAAEAVEGVANDAAYTLTFSALMTGVPFWYQPTETFNVLNQEGTHGLAWAASPPALQDPRVPLRSIRGGFTQNKYTSQAVTLTIADGIQARMIEAEAQLQPANAPSGPWLATLNSARATRGLADTTDPGTAAGRIDLLFRERAFWFYLNGQRLGDMRRLVRQYNRLPSEVYASGTYAFATTLIITYGSEYVLVPPRTEQEYNPLYQGCIDKRP